MTQRSVGSSHARHRARLVLCVAVALGGACSPVELTSATEVRVVLSGPADATAMLMSSRSFTFVTDEQGGIVVDPGDYVETSYTLPFDTTFQLGTPPRLLLRVTGSDPATAVVRMQVWLDGRPQLDGSGTVPPATLQYIFQGS